jgi:hypothetical protein
MEKNSKEYIEKATAEVLHPTLAVTRALLEENALELENGVPKVERIDFDHTADSVAVYFPMKGQRCFLSVHLTKAPEVEVQFVVIESGHQTYLTATSEVLSFAEISQGLALKPVKGWSKGDWRRHGKSQYEFSRLVYTPFSSDAYSLERQLELLLTDLEMHSKSVLKLTKIATTYISVRKYQHVHGNAGVHLSTDTIRRLSALNLSLDMDTYLVGNADKEE